VVKHAKSGTMMYASAQFLTACFPFASLGLILVSGVCMAVIM
jgi:hypothetical protein